MSIGNRRARRVGRYHLLDRVACGGMAEVYRAKLIDADGTEHLIGLKKVLDMYSTDRNFLRMLVAEYHLSALLHHPNIAEIYELIRVPEGYFIAMEYVDGKDLRGSTLRAIEQRRGFDVNDAVYLMARALDGLEHAHNATAEDGTPLHLVHRDFSPSNVLVGYDGSVKIIDFGIAKASVPRDQTAAGIIKGKVRYMSPEQANGDPRLTAQSDVFSAGSCLYELLSGRPAFHAPNELEMIYAVRRAQPVTIGEVAPHVPEPLREIVRKAMARSRRERYRSAGEFRDALVNYLRDTAPGYRRTRLANFMRLLWDVEIEQEIAALLEFAISDEPAAAAENLLASVNTNESLAAAGLSPGARPDPAPSGPYAAGAEGGQSDPETRAINRTGASRAAGAEAGTPSGSAKAAPREAEVVHSNRRAPGAMAVPRLSPQPVKPPPTLTGLETLRDPKLDSTPPPPSPTVPPPVPVGVAPRPKDTGKRPIVGTPATNETSPRTEPIEVGGQEGEGWTERRIPQEARVAAAPGALRVPRPGPASSSANAGANASAGVPPRPPLVPRLGAQLGEKPGVPRPAVPVPAMPSPAVRPVNTQLKPPAMAPSMRPPPVPTFATAPVTGARASASVAPPAVPRPRPSMAPAPAPAAPATVRPPPPPLPSLAGTRRAGDADPAVPVVAPPRPRLGANSAASHDEREPAVPGLPRIPGAPRAPAPDEATFAERPKKH